MLRAAVQTIRVFRTWVNLLSPVVSGKCVLAIIFPKLFFHIGKNLDEASASSCLMLATALYDICI